VTAATRTLLACPTTWCRRTHNESPDESVIHESERVEVFCVPDPNGLSTPTIRVSVGQTDDERVYVLVGEDELSPAAAAHLIEVLQSALDQAYTTLTALTEVTR
jgi:hypothetical protein